MANPYKSIGNTAAAVVSILAIGTLCWWQRPVTPINAPRPQDEAEIMTAGLERPFSMLLTNTQTNTIGFFPNATFNYPSAIRSALTDREYPYSDPYYDAKWLLPPSDYFTGGWNGLFATPAGPQLDSDPTWWTNWVTLSVQTLIEQSNTVIVTTNIASITTNETYTVEGYVVNVGYYAAYYALDGVYTEWTAGKVFVAYASGCFDIPDEGAGGGQTLRVETEDLGYSWVVRAGSVDLGKSWRTYGAKLPDDCPLLVAEENGFSWLDLTVNFAGYTTVTNYQTTNISSMVTNTYPYNAWTDGAKFAFERDAKPYWWSTNAYNDMARALSLMQWQRRRVQQNTDRKILLVYSGKLDHDNQGVFTETFTTQTGTMSSADMIWGGVADKPTGEWYFNVDPDFYISGSIKLCTFPRLTNLAPFTIDCGTVFATNLMIITNSTYLTPTFISSATPLLVLCNNVTLPPGGGINDETVWGSPCPWGHSLDGMTVTQACDHITAELRTAWAGFRDAESNEIRTVYGGTVAGGDYYTGIAPGYRSNNLYRLPYYECAYKPVGYFTYRVQFAALTNYLDHAPAR